MGRAVVEILRRRPPDRPRCPEGYRTDGFPRDALDGPQRGDRLVLPHMDAPGEAEPTVEAHEMGPCRESAEGLEDLVRREGSRAFHAERDVTVPRPAGGPPRPGGAAREKKVG